ncbi:MAG: hypothetical protein K2P81_13000 [Bacteriovoracaceae bacterium]|nr:hypothetical protein [Bacteriovoracaceae bacterium]
MTKKISWPLVFLMGCIGITVEIFFTAFYDLFTGASGLALKGQSYVWMFPIYCLAGLGFPILMEWMKKIPWWGRIFIEGLGILVVEYIAGFILRETTGRCPWEYQTGLHIHGLIRLDYYPFWVLFSLGVERIILWLRPKFL